MAINPDRSPLDMLNQFLGGSAARPIGRPDGVDGQPPRRDAVGRGPKQSSSPSRFSSDEEVASAKSRIRSMLERNLFGPDMLNAMRARSFTRLQPMGQIIDIRI